MIDSCSADQPISNFIILFKGVLGRNDYRALYKMSLDDFDEEAGIEKIAGAANAPAHITADMVMTFYKYNSGSKEFATLGTSRHFTATTDGISLKKEF